MLVCNPHRETQARLFSRGKQAKWHKVQRRAKLSVWNISGLMARKAVMEKAFCTPMRIPVLNFEATLTVPSVFPLRALLPLCVCVCVCMIIGINSFNECHSKTKVIPANKKAKSVNDLPTWSYDGSSTDQASGNDSDLLIKPVRTFHDPLRGGDDLLGEQCLINQHETGLIVLSN